MTNEQKWTDWLLMVVILLLESAWPCMFQYVNNFQEAQFSDALLFTGIFLISGILSFGLCLLLLRSPLKAAVLGSAVLFVVMHYGLLVKGLKTFFPWIRMRWVLLAVLLALLALFLLLRRWKKSGRVMCQLLCIFFAAQFVMMLVPFVPKKLAQMQEIRQNTQMAVVETPEVPPETLPNVYYYIYDEYAGPVGLDHYYGEEEWLYPELEQRGFSCSYSSYNTESCATVQLIPDLFALSYDVPPYFISGNGESPRLYRLFSAMGYQVKLANHLNFLDTDGAENLTPNQQPDSICVTLYERCVYTHTPLDGLFVKLPQLTNAYFYRTGLQTVLEKMEHPEVGEGPTLTIGYVELPHTPFVSDAEGGEVLEDTDNWKDPRFYLDQMEFTRNHILRAVDNILAEDPGAVIILQSDHGARKAYHMMELYGQPYDEVAETPYMQNVLNCVYLGGESLDIEGKTGINTLIAVLNKQFGFAFSEVPPVEGFVQRYP